MIERVLGHLADHGIDDAVLSLGYRPDAFINAYPDGSIAGVRAHLRRRADPAGHGRRHPVRRRPRRHRRDLRGGERGRAHRHRHRRAGGPSTGGAGPRPPSASPRSTTRAPSVWCRPTSEGRVEAFIEKPPRDEAPTNLINAGIYVLEPSVLDRIPAGRRVSIERETFPALVEEGSLYALGSDAYWLDTGTPDAYLRAHRDLLVGRRPGPPAPGAELDPSLGPGVWRIGDGRRARAAWPARLLGQGASVAADAVVDGLGGRRRRGRRGGARWPARCCCPGRGWRPGPRWRDRSSGPDAIIGQRCVIHGCR